MKLFMDSSNIQAIAEWAPTGILDGITTNPTNLSKEGGDPTARIIEICKILRTEPINVEITELEAGKVYAQAKQIAKLAPNVVVKIPCHKRYLEIIKKLALEHIPINITLVFSVTQALIMCKLGVRYISPFVGRWDEIGADGMAIMHNIRDMIDTYGFETQLLAASIRNVKDVNQAIACGADIVTMAPELFHLLIEHPLTDKGMQIFSENWNKLNIVSFP